MTSHRDIAPTERNLRQILRAIPSAQLTSNSAGSCSRPPPAARRGVPPAGSEAMWTDMRRFEARPSNVISKLAKLIEMTTIRHSCGETSC